MVLIIASILSPTVNIVVLSANMKSSPAVMKIRKIIEIKGKQCRL